jgi:hypothetical protein
MYADKLRERGNLSATRLLHLAHPLLTHVRSNKSAIINYGARYRSGRRIATALAESGVNSLVADGQSEAPIFCFRFGPPFLTAIFGSASGTSRRNKPIGRESRGCSNRHHRCSRPHSTPAHLTLPTLCCSTTSSSHDCKWNMLIACGVCPPTASRRRWPRSIVFRSRARSLGSQ